MFADNKFAKVWKIYPKEKQDQKFTDVQLSTSKKGAKKGEYITDFSDNARLIGEAHTKAADLEANDRIKIKSCGVTNFYSKEKNKKFYTFCIFDFEFDSRQKQEKADAQANDETWVDMSVISDEDLPFAD